MSARSRIGIDLGGTKIEGAAIDASGSVCVGRRIATPARDYRATIDAIIALIGGIEQEIGSIASVGIGIPGAVSLVAGLVKNASSTWLIGRPLQRDVEEALGRYMDRLARGLASVINLIDPDAILLGGGLSAISALYREVPQLWRRYVFSDQVRTRLLPPAHGGSSGVRGAAWLWRPDETP